MTDSEAVSLPRVISTLSVNGVGLSRFEFSWAWDDQAGTVPENIQGWSGDDVTAYSSTSRRSGDLARVVVDDITGQLMSRAMTVGLPKPQMRAMIHAAVQQLEPKWVPEALTVDGRNVPGAIASIGVAHVGHLTAVAARSEEATITVIHDGPAASPISLTMAESALP